MIYLEPGKYGLIVDFIIGNRIAIEVKSTSRVQSKHLKRIKALKEEVPLIHKIIISLDDKKRVIDEGFIVYPVKEFFADLWEHKIFY